MGGAFYRGLSKIFPPDSLFICDRHPEKLKALGAKHCSGDLNEVLKNAQTIILAVKPQSFSEFCQNLRVPLAKKLIISIMAGICIDTLQKKLKAQKIVRAMPNLPVQVGLGMTGWIATKKLSSIDKKLVRKIFQSMGKELELKTEKKNRCTYCYQRLRTGLLFLPYRTFGSQRKKNGLHGKRGEATC